MEIKVYFSEIQAYVAARFGRDLTLAKVSDNEFHVTVAQNLLFKTVQVGVDLSVVEVESHAVTLAYNGNLGLNMIISGLMPFIKSKFPEYVAAIELKDNRCIRIDLTKIEQAAAFVQNCELRALRADSDALIADIALKS